MKLLQFASIQRNCNISLDWVWDLLKSTALLQHLYQNLLQLNNEKLYVVILLKKTLHFHLGFPVYGIYSFLGEWLRLCVEKKNNKNTIKATEINMCNLCVRTYKSIDTRLHTYCMGIVSAHPQNRKKIPIFEYFLSSLKHLFPLCDTVYRFF